MEKNRPNKSFVAQYRRIEVDLRDRIRSGRWGAGAMLPGRRDLAQEYQVSSVTVTRAVDTLIAEGLLQVDSRRGTFVASQVPLLELEPAEAAGHSAQDTDFFHAAGQTFVVGIVASTDSGPGTHSAVILRALEHDISKYGHVTTICDRAQAPHAPHLPLEEAITRLLKDRVDALAVICLDLDRVRVEEALSHVNLRNTPTVCVLAGELHLPVPHVFYDNRIGGYQAARHLIDKGQRQMTVLAPFRASWVTERIEGIRHALSHSRQPLPKLQLLHGDGKDWDYQSNPSGIGVRATEMAIETGWIPQGGIICINDQVAHGFCHATSQQGLLVGKDFAVVGFDDADCARSGGLTTMRPPLEAMGREAARLLMDEMRGSCVSLQVRLRAHLITRASTNFTPHKPVRRVAQNQRELQKQEAE